MPWDCCGVQLVDNVRKCPSCGTSKANWTVRFEATRRLVLGKAENEWEVVEEIDEEEPTFELLEQEEVDEEEDYEVVEDDDEPEEFELLVEEAEDEVEELELLEHVDDEEPTYELLEDVPKQKEKARATTWIEVVLQDAVGVPLVGARCKLTFGDGSEREERTGQGGLLRLDGVPAGNVVVMFLDHPLTMKVT